MVNFKDLTINALNYYDNNYDKYNKFLHKIKFFSVEKSDKDMTSNNISFFDKKQNLLLKSRYEIIGEYNSFSNTWIWSWSKPDYKKNLTYLSRQILKYGLDIDITIENIFLKTELITSRFRISDPIQLDVHMAIASYIAKQPLIYNLYIPLKNIPNSDQEFMNFEQASSYNYWEMIKTNINLDNDTNNEYLIVPLFILDP